MTTTNDSSLAETMAEVARLLQAENDLDTTWTRITELAVERLHGVEHAGVTVVARGVPSSAAASDDLPPAVDAIQAACGEGPCLDAVTEQDTFRTGDLEAETRRWPVFGPRVARELGVHSIVSYRMTVQDDVMGALNFYSRQRDAFGDDLVAAGSVFAAHAALALANAKEHRTTVNLTRALDTSRVIGAAVGILMAHHRLTDAQAFDVLKTYSQNTNRKLREVADDVVHTGEVPGVEARRPR